MRKILSIVLLVIGSLSLTSCIDILEDIYIKKDGSGEYSLMVSFNNAIQKATSQVDDNAQPNENDLAKMNENEEEGDYKKTLEAIVQQLQNTKGITDVELVEGTLEYGYKYKFESIEALNDAFEITAGEYHAVQPQPYQLGKSKNNLVEATANYIERNKNTIVRHQNAELAKVYNIQNNQGSNAGMAGGLNIAYILQDLSFTTTYRLDNKIKSVSNAAAVMDDGAITISCLPFAYTPADLKEAKMQEEACESSIQIELR